MVLQTVRRQKIRDIIVERLKSYIATQGLQSGDRLPTETTLAAQFGVSRLSLREATKALEFLGIVAAKTGVGLTVGQIDLDRVASHLGFHPALQKAPSTELIDTRIVIETGALAYTSRRIAEDPALLEPLQQTLDRFRGTRDLQEWIELDIQFHRALLDASGLAPLVAFGDLLQIFFHRFRESVKKAEWQCGIDSHQRILDYLGKQDVKRATNELRRHIESHRQRLGRQT